MGPWADLSGHRTNKDHAIPDRGKRLIFRRLTQDFPGRGFWEQRFWSVLISVIKFRISVVLGSVALNKWVTLCPFNVTTNASTACVRASSSENSTFASDAL